MSYYGSNLYVCLSGTGTAIFRMGMRSFTACHFEAGIATMASHLPSGLADSREIVVRPAAVKSPTTDQPVAPSRHNEIFEPDAISMPPSGNHVRYWLSARASVMTFVFLVAGSSSLITAGAP